MYIHTHPFNGPFSGTTHVSQYQNGKTNLDFTDIEAIEACIRFLDDDDDDDDDETRDSEWQWHQLGHMQVCT